jgi:hypothetical protein
MANDGKSKGEKVAEADGWVDSPVREAPDAPLVRQDAAGHRARSSDASTKPAADDAMWTTRSDSPAAATGVTLPEPPGVKKKPPKPEPLSDIDSGKAMAILAHTSIVLALPVFLAPLIMRQNDFALHHAKAAGANFLFFVIFGVLAVLTKGLAVPLMFLCYIPALVGIVNAANGRSAGQLGLGPLGERIFHTIAARDDDSPKLPE